MKLNIQIFLICILSILFTGTAFSQEVCDNGIDDDNDGFVDCYDNSCAGNAACEDFFMGDEATCEAFPTEFPTFAMETLWTSPNGTAATWSRASVGDVDGDGIPEIIVTNRPDKNLHVLSGADGSIIQKIDLSHFPDGPEHEVAMADFEGDGYAEFVVSGRKNEIEAYTFDPGLGRFKLMWKANSNPEGGHEKGRPMVLGLADFKGTGNVQLYYKNEIRDAKTGLRLVNGIGDWEVEVNFAPVAVDILDDSACDDCSGLELVSGGTIYSVNLGDGTKDSGYLTVEKTIPGNNYFVRANGWENWSSTSVADYNLDGYLDVISSGAIGDLYGPTTVFFWDVKADKVITYSPKPDWNKGTGRLNSADIDGNGS